MVRVTFTKHQQFVSVFIAFEQDKTSKSVVGKLKCKLISCRNGFLNVYILSIVIQQQFPKNCQFQENCRFFEIY